MSLPSSSRHDVARRKRVNRFTLVQVDPLFAMASLDCICARRALNTLNKTPCAEVVAAFSYGTKELERAKQHLEPFDVYDNYDTMIEKRVWRLRSLAQLLPFMRNNNGCITGEVPSGSWVQFEGGFVKDI
ncbi:hypothetical protein IQ07DRAFT_77217 [Pyrenochaeta sp. DS3sAY3a]|nr:hypothetical protein IQ07DRAFT_77217 [Pyrenochaeta sp. DS3sAY3a]